MAETKKRIRVVYTIPNFDTAGSGKALLQIALGLDPKIFEAHIVCNHDRGDFFKVVKASGLPVHIFDVTCPMRPYNKGLWGCYKISKRFKAIQPDIIHSFHYAADYSEPLAAKLAGLKWIYTKKNMNWGGASKNGWRLRTLLAHAIVVQNTDMATSFFPKLNNIHLIPRGVNTNLFARKPPDISLRFQWDLKPSDRIFCCVANLVPVKGIEIVIRAFKKLHEEYPNWRFIIVGDYDNTYGQSMVNLAESLQIHKKVIFCGKQADVNNYLNISECFILPTLNTGRKEGSPVSLLEAMASGLNVLGSNISGIKDQLSEFPKHLVEPGHVESWCQALEFVFNLDTEENLKQGELFRQHVISHYTIEREVELSEKLYLRL